MLFRPGAIDGSALSEDIIIHATGAVCKPIDIRLGVTLSIHEKEGDEPALLSVFHMGCKGTLSVVTHI